MKNVTDQSWKREFARSAARRAEQIRFFNEVERRHKEDRVADRLEDEAADLAVTALTMATDTQIVEFRTELGDWRTATVESLMEDEKRLAEIRDRLEAQLAKAYVLPDGRRVFKFKDGVRVIDEYGVEVAPEVIDPNMIEDWRPPADDYVVDLELERDVQDLRGKKLELLDHIDAMEGRLDKGDLTTDDLADMRKELEEFAPEDIKRRRLGDEYRPPVKVGEDFAAATATAPADAHVGRDLQVPAFDR